MTLNKQSKKHPIAVKVFAFAFAFGLAACSEAEKPSKSEGSASTTTEGALPEVNLTIRDGAVVFKDPTGNAIGDECSLDPNAKNVCPILKPGHRVQMEEVVSFSQIKYSGSPQCYLIIVGGKAYILPSAEYCSQ